MNDRLLLMFIVLAGAIFAAGPAPAEQNMGDMQMAAPAEKPVHARGVVKSVDLNAGRTTISHDPIPSLAWPAMTMTFEVRDRAMLAGIKPGMSVNFDFERVGRGYRITRIAPGN